MKFLPLLAALTAASTDAQSPINNNPDPITTPSPTPTADAAGILGWYTFQGKWFTSACLPGASYSTLSSFANCHKGSAFPTACRSNSIMYNDGSHLNCDLDRCETATVYESRGGRASSAVLCYATAAFREEPRTFYRTTFALSGTESVSKTETSTSGSGSSVTTPTGSPTTSNAGTTSNGSPTTSTGSGTTSAAATPTVVLHGGRAVFWAGVTTVVMMAFGAVMFI